jgi:hypothetical protein
MNSKIYDPKKDIINTLSYKKIFGQPLTFYQIMYFSHTKFENISEPENHLRELLERHKIKYKSGYYFLGTSKHKKDETKDFEKKISIASSTYEKLNSIKFIFEKLPFIQFVGVTGTLASYNFDFENDDIDLFFICQRNRLWLSRFFIVLILKILNIYVNNKTPKIKICPNLYISEEKMSWTENKRNLYVAHEIAMMQPLVDKDNTYFKFLSENSWISEYLPNFSIDYHFEKTNYNQDTTLLDLIDDFFMIVQKFFMKVRFGSEILEKNIIHFVKTDHSINILENYEKIKS